MRPLQLNHPFQLSNTLANINNNHSRQQRQQNARAATRSTSVESSQSSTGGVDVRSSASASSGGSSQTITNEPVGRKRTFSRSVDVERLAQAYDASVEYDDDEAEDEEY